MFQNVLKFLTLFLLAVVAYSVASINRTPYSKLSKSVVKVTRLEGGGGTGFLVDGSSGNPYLVTNAHVCGSAQSMLAQRGTELTQYILPVLKVDGVNDLCALLPIPGDSLKFGKAPNRFQELYVLGHPLLYPQKVSRGYYLGDEVVEIGGPRSGDKCPAGQREVPVLWNVYCVWSMELSQTSAVIYPGNSGSPITDQDGALVGVINSGNEMHEGGFIPLAALKTFLETL